MVMTFNLGDWRSANVDNTKDTLVFGVDTDKVDDNETGPNPPFDSDQGGDFGENPPPSAAIGRIWFEFELSDGVSTLTAIYNSGR